MSEWPRERVCLELCLGLLHTDDPEVKWSDVADGRVVQTWELLWEKLSMVPTQRELMDHLPTLSGPETGWTPVCEARCPDDELPMQLSPGDVVRCNLVRDHQGPHDWKVFS